MADLSRSNIVSYPDRGPWGDSKYRGNTSGWLIRDLIEFFQPKSVLDPMEGSRTTGGTAGLLTQLPLARHGERNRTDVGGCRAGGVR